MDDVLARLEVPRLLRLAVRADARVCVAAAPEREEHDLGVLASAVAATDAARLPHAVVHEGGIPEVPTSMERAVDAHRAALG